MGSIVVVLQISCFFDIMLLKCLRNYYILYFLFLQLSVKSYEYSQFNVLLRPDNATRTLPKHRFMTPAIPTLDWSLRPAGINGLAIAQTICRKETTQCLRLCSCVVNKYKYELM